MRTLLTLLAAALLAGCSFVDLKPEAEKVVVLKPQEVAACERLGHTTVSLLDKLAGIERDREKVQKELDTLARNSALDLGGDAVVRESGIEDGHQRYGVYRCRR